MWLKTVLSHQEVVRINFTLNKSLSELYAETIKELCTVPNLNDGDDLKIHYQFNIQYFGEIVKKLKAVLTLLNDPIVIVNCNHEELLHGQCLIEEVLLGLKNIEAKLCK